ncbi:HpcH/HpaI aldolase/citrate lyase family protein [Nocardioides sp. NPDC087217]|uniref:HpcH/HpaI aldolase/citrate lyase family protein n=1 Tax=Nocardioides sp. NPDC087217 TaxID=3364335 RepID=UPI0038244F0E
MSQIAARSLLFVPGDRPDRFAKAERSGADGIVLDLEDAVAPDRKAIARSSAVEWLAARPGFVRINAHDSGWHEDDLESLAAAHELTGVIIAKCESTTDVERVRTKLPQASIIALVESAVGVLQAPAIARSPGVDRLAFGSIDFALDARIRPTPDEPELELARSTIVLASRAAGLPSPLDGVHADLRGSYPLTRNSRRSWDRGFGGRLCVHPDQVDAVNAAYGPTDNEIEWAKRVLAAARHHEGGAFRFEGRMVDRPVIELARLYATDADSSVSSCRKS